MDASLRDDGTDTPGPEQAAVLFVVVAVVREECVRSVPWTADDAGHGRDLVEQGQKLGDVVAVSAGQRDRERDALAVGDDVVLAAWTC